MKLFAPPAHRRIATSLNPSARSARRPQLVGASGFTLIELLVVIAIIGILAALLLPTLGRA